MTSYEEIIYQVDDPVATITLNRPHALNAWTDRMGLEVRHAVATAERDPRVVGIVLVTAFAPRGLVAEWGISWLLPHLVGPAVALDLLFSSRKVTGVEAAALRLVNAALPRDQVLAHAQQYVRDLAATSSPTSMAIMKRQVYQQLHAGMLNAEREARQLMMESFGRPDFREGVSSFVEHRPPIFKRLARDAVSTD